MHNKLEVTDKELVAWNCHEFLESVPQVEHY
jgi:hypothetical protein